MELAERFGMPVVTFVDVPGAHPGPESEERGIAESIARSIGLMSRLRTPIVTVITGEGSSGGALAIAVGCNARERRGQQGKQSFRLLYSAISVLMIAVGLVMLLFFGDWRHMVLALETIEIILFAVFWLAQTNEHWYETT